jgi:hypothetical protein
MPAVTASTVETAQYGIRSAPWPLEVNMYLIEILLPISDNGGKRFDAQKYMRVREGLTRRFGGITAFTRAPAEGISHANGEVVHDDIIVFEVMTDTLDGEWWGAYRQRLEKEFAQDEIIIRASTVVRL